VTTDTAPDSRLASALRFSTELVAVVAVVVVVVVSLLAVACVLTEQPRWRWLLTRPRQTPPAPTN
jgi:hypothetical protein